MFQTGRAIYFCGSRAWGPAEGDTRRNKARYDDPKICAGGLLIVFHLIFIQADLRTRQILSDTIDEAQLNGTDWAVSSSVRLIPSGPFSAWIGLWRIPGDSMFLRP